MTKHRPILSTIRTAAFTAMLSCAASGQVELRGGAVVDQQVERVSAAGVLLAASETQPARTLGWHRVKRVAGEFDEQARAYATLSDDLWRATSRLERGDTALAAPIFERLWAGAIKNESDPHTIAGVRLAGPTGLALARGVAAVRIAQGAHAQAVEPWTVSIALRETAPGNAAPEESLIPSLPPIFVRSVAVERLASLQPLDVIAQDDRARALFAIYQRAAALACDTEAPTGENAAPAADTAFAEDVVIAQSPDDGPRREAVRRLQGVVREHHGTWREAWARAAIGIAMVEHEAGRERLAGAVELLHVPARFASTQPYLSGIALGWASVAVAEETDASRARSLREELEARHPFSPAIGWLVRRDSLGGGS